MAAHVLELLRDRDRAAEMGRAGREQVIARWTVDRMVRGYEDLIAELYAAKSGAK
jgi:glycosyltransferase involved in cell wall biosynthesis